MSIFCFLKSAERKWINITLIIRNDKCYTWRERKVLLHRGRCVFKLLLEFKICKFVCRWMSSLQNSCASVRFAEIMCDWGMDVQHQWHMHCGVANVLDRCASFVSLCITYGRFVSNVVSEIVKLVNQKKMDSELVIVSYSMFFISHQIFK
jgi:hypothetical protein